MAGIGAAATINVNIGKDGSPVSPSDFMLDFVEHYREPETEPSVDADAVARQFEVALWGCVN